MSISMKFEGVCERRSPGSTRQSKAALKARGRFLGGCVPFGFRCGDDGQLVVDESEQSAIGEIVALRAEGNGLRAIAKTMRAKGIQLSHETVRALALRAGVLPANGAASASIGS
jgi:hypothetical protein